MTEDFKTEELLFMARKIGMDLTTLIEFYFKNEDMSGIQAYFMVYILRHHPGRNIFYRYCPGDRGFQVNSVSPDKKS